jgi:ankyrin repeat protein
VYCSTGNADGLRRLPPDVIATSMGVPHGWLLMHAAARGGHAACITALAECGVGSTILAVTDTLGAPDAPTPSDSEVPEMGWTAAMIAAANGHVECLEVLVDHGGLEALTKTNIEGETPAHRAAREGRVACLVALAQHGAVATFLARNKNGDTAANLAAMYGHSDCLNVLATHGGIDALTAADVDGNTPEFWAAVNGHAECLKVIATHGAAATFVMVDTEGFTPAAIAALKGHAECLKVIATHGGIDTLTAVDVDGYTPAHWAAEQGHAECLNVLVTHCGIDALTAPDSNGTTPAHVAAQQGHVPCLEMIHRAIAATAERDLEHLSAIKLASSKADVEKQIRMHARLAVGLHDHVEPPLHEMPIYLALQKDHLACVQFLVRIGGAQELHSIIAARPERLKESPYTALLSQPGLLDFACKRAWMQHTLEEVVTEHDDAAEALSLVSRRGGVLEGLCAHLGVNEQMGDVVDDDESAQPRGVSIRFEGEAAAGDGLRREWFDEIVGEIVDVERGLFTSADGGRTMQPNPHSATVAGPDHLSYFALLGRVAGLALYHQEPLDVRWSDAFVKAVLEMPITADDLRSVDPELHERKVNHTCTCSLAHLHTCSRLLLLSYFDSIDTFMSFPVCSLWLTLLVICSLALALLLTVGLLWYWDIVRCWL